MSSVLVPNTTMVEMVFTHHTQRIQNVFHVLKPAGAPDLTDLQAIRQIFLNWWNPVSGTSYKGIVVNNVALVLIKCTSLHSVGAPFHEYILPSAVSGVLGSTNSPPFVSIAVKWNTGLAGRNYRGRTYMVGPQVVAASDGLFSTTYQGQISAAFTKIITDVAAAGYKLVVASKYDGVEIVNGRRRGIPRLVGITTEIVSCGVERTYDTNRKRKVPHNV